MSSEFERQPPKLKLVTPEFARAYNDAMAPNHDIEWSVLMARAQTGDATAYRKLLEDISPYLRSLAARCHRNPNDVEDALQDILLTLHAIRATYDPARPFGPWLKAIANRRLIDRLRRQARKTAHETTLEPEHENLGDTSATATPKLSPANLEKALASLTPGQREAIHLLKLNELSLKEASSKTGLSIATLKTTTHRAMAALRRALLERNEP